MFPILPGSNPSGYNLTRSLRFRRSASAYLSRTPAGAGNTLKYTFSGWLKRGDLVNFQGILGGGTTSPSYDTFQFDQTTNRLGFFQSGGNTTALYTTAVFRDPSAWYHIVLAYDSAQATASNRVKIYVNGVLQALTGTYPTLNLVSFINNVFVMALGAVAASATFINLYDGYMTEVNFIDGQALTPSSFGAFSATTGVWQPARYAGTYGTNGFYLPFTDNSALTTSSNVGLGRDYSGNGNFWATTNISLTAGVNYDSMTDVPTLTNATAANYAVMNPLNIGTTTAIQAANLLCYYATTANWITAGNTFAVSSGKFYWEITCDNMNSGIGSDLMLGLAAATVNYVGSNLYTGQNALDYGYYSSNGFKYNSASGSAYGATYANNDVIGVAFDADNRTLTFYKNNVSQGVAFSSIPAGLYMPTVSSKSGVAYANFGQRPFAYTPPTGFVALNTFNLPTSTIVKGNTVMDATLYTGTNATLNVTNAGGFQPDFVWIKNRTSALSHYLNDSVRGAYKTLFSNLTNAEYDGTSNSDGVSAFNSNGFTLLNGTNALNYNQAANNYVGWQWKAGGTSSSNTDGSITSTVSVNASAGFSVVTYTGTGANATVGHGLGVAPSMIIVKDRSNGDGNHGWGVYHRSTGASGILVLNATSAFISDTTAWNNTSPTSSVFSLGSALYSNTSGDAMLAYCWSEIDGFSKFGSYTGNGSTNGPFVYTGFRPKFVMIKRSDSTSNWYMFDTSRNTFNVMTNELLANSSNAEANENRWIDGLSNGFKIRNDAANQINASGGTMIYMAFAENPFKNALAR